ncbi:TPA: phage tail protein [Serratia marcescens]|uniref:phage tail-collar fiber domain-containing protein n=1 Tax=Serratia marcescens TaxID=615 RepID=UPI0018D7B9E3|nr:phage tail protein [Serratia marcescens]MBH2690133.1 phage tail protein [Serratia marcescens]MBH2737826.1 phage tail protein [Serratia marcescens]MBH2829567.1 phage tail protein [Serratia marcescens]MBH3223468.1 phage tail protein [Serratia marcescens]QVV71855.1 phage tail protein [Serratia marcescens]
MNKYKAIITTAGAAKIAAASAGGTQLKIISMAVGDGNGTLPTPNPAQTKLVNEKYRAALNGLTIDKALKNHILAEMIIPANVGGFWLREMGLYDEAGTLIAVSNMAESYKPKLEEGSGRTQTLRMILIVSSTEAIQVIAGGDTVLATKDYVTDAITAHEKTRNHPDASTTAKGLVQLSSATTSTDETKASTPKALKAVNDASMKKDANLSDLSDKAAARGNLALGTAATKNVGVEGGNVMAVGAFGLGSGSRHRDNAYCNQGEIYRVNNTSKNTPTTEVAGVISLPCDGGPSSGYVAVSNSGAAWVGGSNIAANGIKWGRVYTTTYKPTAADVQAADHRNNFAARMGVQRVLNGADMPTSAGVWSVENSTWTPVPWGSLYVTTNQSTLTTEPGNQRFIHYLFIGHGNGNKLYAATNNNGSFSGWSQYYSTAGKPTAADVGALTDAQAAQKYALRSIKVNGKPLSADVNLLAGDVNAWNKTEADGRYLVKTGGQLTGTLKTSAEIQSTHIDNYRMVGGGFGSFWRNDGNRLYLLLTKENDQYGTFNNLRPFSVDVRTGAAAFESGMHIGGNWPAITTSSGTTWHPDGNVQGSCWGGYLSNWLNQNISAAQNNAQNWAYQHLVQGVRMAGRTVIADTGGRIDLPSGCVYTGMSGSNYNPSIWGAYSAVQVLINGTWATIGTV